MRTLLLLPFLLVFISPGQSQTGAVSDDGSSLAVLSYKWSKSRQVIEKTDSSPEIAPAPAMISTDKNYERNARENATKGATRDIKAETADGRSAALEKSVQQARTPQAKDVDGFSYKVKVRNTGPKIIEIVFWEYRFTETANPANVVHRQFLCGVNIKPDKEKELQALSLSGPSNVISVESLSNSSKNLFQEKIVINRVEYADGTIWQRRDWNFSEVKQAIARATSTPWQGEMCRGL